MIMSEDLLPFSALLTTPANIKPGHVFVCPRKGDCQHVLEGNRHREAIAKHCTDDDKIMAVETLMKNTEKYFRIRHHNGSLNVLLMPVSEAVRTRTSYTKMSYILSAKEPRGAV